jgi:ABC-type dipeptide/oligopeptide/nickel transport system ATPase component
MADHLLEVQDLRMHFYTRDGIVKAVDGVTYTRSTKARRSALSESRGPGSRSTRSR